MFLESIMEGLAAVVFLTALLPGALLGLIWGFRRSMLSALISALIGGVGGFAGAMGISKVMSGPFWSGPWGLVSGSIIGALVVLFIFNPLRRSSRN
jgi:hypothetical protein